MKKIFLIVLVSVGFFNCKAEEGMWLPHLIANNILQMQNMGCKLTADQIYSSNLNALNHAIVQFGSGCTGSVISNKGLVVTNHHCGYGTIIKHSTLEKNYLDSGFVASDFSHELQNPGLTVRFVRKIEDVTQLILQGTDSIGPSKLDAFVNAKIKKLIDENERNTHYKILIKPFSYGKQYLMFTTELFEDVRLVYAPPAGVGKFGGEVDNWEYPRHTGDFTLFRIYADADNKPAKPSEKNVPYSPSRFLKINIAGVAEGDFTMVYGFPGRTEEYLPYQGIDLVQNYLNPKTVTHRAQLLDLMGSYMAQSTEQRLKYAADYSGIANYWKKWDGERQGLIKSNSILIRKQLDQKIYECINQSDSLKKLYGHLPDAFDTLYGKMFTYQPAVTFTSEALGKGLINQQLLRIAKIISDEPNGNNDNLRPLIEQFINSKPDEADYQISKLCLNNMHQFVDIRFKPNLTANLTTDQHSKFINDIYSKTVFTDLGKLKSISKSKKLFKLISSDPLVNLYISFYKIYSEEVIPKYQELDANLDFALSQHIDAQLACGPQTRYYPDANLTLRVAYGKVEGYKPRNAVNYQYYTTTTGVLEKHATGDPDFACPKKLIEMFEKGDFGIWADKENQLRVAFTASNHTTGGNSGSPVLDANGNLIGINFDRNAQGTMSDIDYNVEICRNISVDVRYMLFIIDKYSGAKHLINELVLVK